MVVSAEWAQRAQSVLLALDALLDVGVPMVQPEPIGTLAVAARAKPEAKPVAKAQGRRVYPSDVKRQQAMEAKRNKTCLVCGAAFRDESRTNCRKWCELHKDGVAAPAAEGGMDKARRLEELKRIKARLDGQTGTGSGGETE